MQRPDLVELRAKFATVNLTDPAAIRKWFTSHPYLTTNDHAQIAGKSAHYIRKLKKKAKMPKGFHPGHKRPNPLQIPKVAKTSLSIEVPENWRTKEWLSKVVKLYSLRQIARAVNRNRTVVRAAMARCGVLWRDYDEVVMSKNPCCTHAWCWRHYVELGLGQEQCAELAGIAQQTFSFWLNRFNIPVRTRFNGYIHGARIITTWEREIIHKLRQQPVVKRVEHIPEFIRVLFHDHTSDRYWTTLPSAPQHRDFAIGSTDTKLEKVPIVYPEYGTDMDGKANFPAHIAISRADLKKASLLERQVAIHEFARQIHTRGWIWPSYPEEALREDFNNAINFNIASNLMNGGFKLAHNHKRPGRKVMLHFFDTSHYWDLIGRPRITFRCLARLAHRSHAKFNLFNLIMAVTRHHRLPFPDPLVYQAIFKRLGITGTMLDVQSGTGNRAIACAVLGIHYTTADPTFQGAIDRGFIEFSGLKHVPYTGQIADVVIYDEGFRAPDMNKVLPYIGKAKKLLVFCPPSHKNEVLKYKPRTAIKIRSRHRIFEPGYLFVW